MKSFLLTILVFISLHSVAQIPEAVFSPTIKTAQLFPYGNQLGYPIIGLNGAERLELHFDDVDGTVRNYSYTYQLCNEDWTPALLSQFDFIKGYSQIRLNTYRVSSVAFTRYTHYQAMLPDKNCYPTRAGNYILKVFRDGDTSKLLFTKRLLVVSEKATVAASVQQPYNGQIFRTHQKVQFKVNLNQSLNVVNAGQQIKVVILQNNRWDNAARNIKPTFFSRQTLEFNTETDAVFPAGKEWRWLDIRSFRLQSDRVAKVNYGTTATEIMVRPDADRSQQRFNFFRDRNGMYNIEMAEQLNPLWQADYATVHFTYQPTNNTPFPSKDIYLFGELTNYDLRESAKMKYDAERGVYTSDLFLKQGYYDYSYVTIDRNDPKRLPSFDDTEGNYWESENEYTILVYFRDLAGRVDELIGIAKVNSLTGKQGLRP